MDSWQTISNAYHQGPFERCLPTVFNSTFPREWLVLMRQCDEDSRETTPYIAVSVQVRRKANLILRNTVHFLCRKYILGWNVQNPSLKDGLKKTVFDCLLPVIFYTRNLYGSHHNRNMFFSPRSVFNRYEPYILLLCFQKEAAFQK